MFCKEIFFQKIYERICLLLKACNLAINVNALINLNIWKCLRFVAWRPWVLVKILVFILLNDVHSSNCRFLFIECFKSRIIIIRVHYTLPISYVKCCLPVSWTLSFYPLEIGFVCSPLPISVKNKGKCDFYLFFLTFLSSSPFFSLLSSLCAFPVEIKDPSND